MNTNKLQKRIRQLQRRIAKLEQRAANKRRREDMAARRKTGLHDSDTYKMTDEERARIRALADSDNDGIGPEIWDTLP